MRICWLLCRMILQQVPPTCGLAEYRLRHFSTSHSVPFRFRELQPFSWSMPKDASSILGLASLLHKARRTLSPRWRSRHPVKVRAVQLRGNSTRGSMKKIAARLFILSALCGGYAYAYPVHLVPPANPPGGGSGPGSCPSFCTVTVQAGCSLIAASCDCSCQCLVTTICIN